MTSAIAIFCLILLGCLYLQAPDQPTPTHLCEHCGRDHRSAIHDGFNGYFVDPAMACPGESITSVPSSLHMMSVTPEVEEYLQTTQSPPIQSA